MRICFTFGTHLILILIIFLVHRITSDLLYQIPVGFPLRIFSIDKSRFSSELRPQLVAPERKNALSSNGFVANDRYADLVVPDPQGSLQSEGDSFNNKLFNYKNKNIPFVPGDSPLEQTIAALEMLAIVHNVPFRRDIVERAGKNSLKKGNISLELVGSLSTFMGFVGNISDIPLRQLTRRPFPCFTFYDTNIVMIYDITRDSVKAVLPAYGRIELSISDLLGDQPGLRVLTLSPGRDSNEKVRFFLVCSSAQEISQKPY